MSDLGPSLLDSQVDAAGAFPVGAPFSEIRLWDLYAAACAARADEVPVGQTSEWAFRVAREADALLAERRKRESA